MEKTIPSIAAMRDFARGFLDTLPAQKNGATIVGLSGDLGSGKTTFVKACAEVLGISDAVLSPTFVLAKFYPLLHRDWSQLVHIDLYRIEDPEEISALRWSTLLADPKNLLLVEWPERLGGEFPESAITLKFQFIDETTRKIRA